MNPPFARVEELFHQALEHEDAERPEFLRRACAGDAELFAAVSRLLVAETQDAQFQSAKAAGRTGEGRTGEWRVGQRFGPYAISGVLGKGGMGSVYLARRADGAFEQEVALKLLAPHLVEDSFAERFRAERQALAHLNHPHIVHLLDGGVNEQGEPYLATEYVKGTTLDRHAREQRLTVPERLRLFLQICAAVEHAHQNLIVHRDLKPSNILVNEQGDAKLLDFGTAKLLSAGGEKTATDAVLLTPRYASPEQLRNEAITTRSDVYALGLIFYELLSGSRPFASSGDAMGELARAYDYMHATTLGKNVTAEAAAERRSSVRDLEKVLSGDLRAIAAKAIESDPAKRYGSVAEFGRDVEAYLEGRAVSARGAGTWYLLSKFLYRQRLAVGAAALLVVAIAAGVVSTVREKQRAERRFGQVRQLARYQLFDVFDEAERLIGSTRMRARLADEALRYLDNLRTDVGNDESLRLELAEGYLRAGNILGNFTEDNLGELAKAKEAFAKGDELVRGLEGDRARWARVNLKLARTLSEYGSATGKGFAGRVEEIVREMEALVRPGAKDAGQYLKLGQAYMSLAKVNQSTGQGLSIEDLSEGWTQKARETLERGLGVDPEHAGILAALHRLCANRSLWLSDYDPKRALGWAGEAEMWGLRRKQAKGTPSYWQAEATRRTGRAAALLVLGNQDQAVEEMRRGEELLRRLAEDEDNFAAQMALMTGLLNLAQIEYELKNKERYSEAVQRAYVIAKREQAKGHGANNQALARLYHKILYDLAYAYAESGSAEAGRVIEEAYQTFRQAAAADANNERARFYLCDLLLNLDYEGWTRPAEAKKYAEEIAQADPKNANGPDFIAQAELAMGNVEGAIAAYRRAQEIMRAKNAGAAGEKFNRFYEEKLQELEKRLAAKK